jgi:hypothetical protein
MVRMCGDQLFEPGGCLTDQELLAADIGEAPGRLFRTWRCGELILAGRESRDAGRKGIGSER